MKSETIGNALRFMAGGGLLSLGMLDAANDVGALNAFSETALDIAVWTIGGITALGMVRISADSVELVSGSTRKIQTEPN